MDLELSDEDVAEIRRLSEEVELPARYDERRMKVVMQETPALL